MKRIAACVLGAMLAVGTFVSSAQAADATTVYTNKANFAIPFRSDAAEIQRLGAREVRLYVSVDAGVNWHQVQSMLPTAERFSVRAPKNGEYWFAVRTVDQNGRLQPDRALAAELSVFVDTESPTLELRLAEAAPGQIQLTWDASDQHLDPASLLIEYRAAGDTNWSRVFADQKKSGVTSWNVPDGGVIEVRGRISDQASNVAIAQDSLRITPNRTNVPKPAIPANSEPIAGSQGDHSQASSMTERFPSAGNKAITSRTISSESGPSLPLFQPARQGETSPRQQSHSASQHRSLPNGSNSPMLPDSQPVTPIGGGGPQSSSAERPLSPMLPSQNSQRSQTPPQSSIPTQVLRRREFGLNYAVDKVGRSGVESVELFITPDNGKKWYRYGTDPDRTSPFSVVVPRDGEYGFAIRVKSGVGLVNPSPRYGDAPEMIVVVDQTAPAVELLPVLQGRGADSHKFLIRWKLTETHSISRPISILYSETAAGPWTVVAADLANSGRFLWSAPEEVPARIYVRVSATDAAGNIGTAETPRPILIDIVKPSARITNVIGESAGR